MAFEGISSKLQNVFKKLTGKGRLSERDELAEAILEQRQSLSHLRPLPLTPENHLFFAVFAALRRFFFRCSIGSPRYHSLRLLLLQRGAGKARARVLTHHPSPRPL